MKAAVIGGGPAGLMAAEVMAQAGLSVTVYEGKPSPARKFLMAGKSGLNLTFQGDFDRVLSGYGTDAETLRPALEAMDNAAIRAWAEDLGQEMFAGSTGRVFPRAMKASPLLRAWLARLDGLGVTLERRAVCDGLQGTQPRINGALVPADVTVLACGGASWARLGSDGAWADWIGTEVAAFQPSNTGVLVDWTPGMARYFGAPVKSVTWTAGAAQSRGEGVITERGLEGGGLYALTPQLRDGATLSVDLLPQISVDDLIQRLRGRQPKTKMARYFQNALHISPAKTALLFEAAGGVPKGSPEEIAKLIKSVPIRTKGLAPMDRAISTVGGVPLSALDAGFMLRDRPGVFCAGEMMDWDAPTGGWLLTACLATGAWAGKAAAAFTPAPAPA